MSKFLLGSLTTLLSTTTIPVSAVWFYSPFRSSSRSRSSTTYYLTGKFSDYSDNDDDHDEYYVVKKQKRKSYEHYLPKKIPDILKYRRCSEIDLFPSDGMWTVSNKHNTFYGVQIKVLESEKNKLNDQIRSICKKRTCEDDIKSQETFTNWRFGVDNKNDKENKENHQYNKSFYGYNSEDNPNKFSVLYERDSLRSVCLHASNVEDYRNGWCSGDSWFFWLLIIGVTIFIIVILVVLFTKNNKKNVRNNMARAAMVNNRRARAQSQSQGNQNNFGSGQVGSTVNRIEREEGLNSNSDSNSQQQDFVQGTPIINNCNGPETQTVTPDIQIPNYGSTEVNNVAPTVPVPLSPTEVTKPSSYPNLPNGNVYDTTVSVAEVRSSSVTDGTVGHQTCRSEINTDSRDVA